MDIRTLPEEEREIYNRIRANYKLTFDKLKVKDQTIRLLKVADIEEFLDGKDPFADVSEFPFWVKLWEAAMILSYALASLPDPKGKTLLELGAGLGAPGITAAACGFDVTLSDYEDIIMDFQKVSVAASGLDNVKCAHIDWLNPPEMESFDVLTAAEVLFREEFFDPLLNVFRKYLKPGGTIYLAHDARRKCLPLFMERAKDEYDIAGGKQTIRKDGQDITIIINRLRAKE
ncbi:MAG TPA: methyltransferase domain-containing protein [Desulfobacterales bacterium]|nr:methyltransferase domain-containing protein [Desulfobacterales bacterium]HIP39990.1 methyltransferase domain-containing protein [Desulfocapsa sulfexigens]